MADQYAGFLIRIGNSQNTSYVIDTKRFIKADSYKTSLKRIDIDSYTDAWGVLHRNVVENVPTKTEFETPELLTNTDMTELMDNIRACYTNERERRLWATVYVPEYSLYKTKEVYLVDPEFQMYGNYHGKIWYRPVRFCFIAY